LVLVEESSEASAPSYAVGWGGERDDGLVVCWSSEIDPFALVASAGVSAVAPLLLLTLSRQYAQTAPPDRSGLQPVADTLAKDDYWAGPFSQIAWSLSVMILLYLLYRSNAVPRFISVWGLVGAPLYLADQLLILYNAPSLFATPGDVVSAQFALNELVLVIWLLVKGFRPTPNLAPEPATTV
jgi:Domain of unknown function (DUF4386)